MKKKTTNDSKLHETSRNGKKKIESCPKETKITTGPLCQAVINLNDRVRNQGLTAGQIHFSRDTIIGENLHLDDKKLIQDKVQKRLENQKSMNSQTVDGR